MLWGFTVTGAAVDWVMSLEPHWFSTIYGMLFIVIECLAGFAFSLFVLRMLSEYEPHEGFGRAQALQRSRQPDAGLRDAVDLSVFSTSC